MKYAHIAVKPELKGSFELAKAKYKMEKGVSCSSTEFIKILLKDHDVLESVRNSKANNE